MLTGIAFNKTQRLASLASCCSIWATSQFCPGQQADQSGVRQQRQPVRADWCCRWQVPLPAGFSLPRACPHTTGTGQERHATTQGEPPVSQSQQMPWSSLTFRLPVRLQGSKALTQTHHPSVTKPRVDPVLRGTQTPVPLAFCEVTPFAG